MADQFMICRR